MKYYMIKTLERSDHEGDIFLARKDGDTFAASVRREGNKWFPFHRQMRHLKTLSIFKDQIDKKIIITEKAYKALGGL